MSHDTVILKIIGGTLHEMRGGGDLVIPRGMERISDSGYLSLDMMPPCIDSITVEDGNPSFYAKNNCLIRKGDGELVLGCRNSVIPDDGSVRSIGALAFNGLPLQELTIPTSVERIGRCAFTEQEVRRLMLPEGLRCVEPLAFMTAMGDDAELELYIPSTLEEIGYGVFRGCPLKRITVALDNPWFSGEGGCLTDRRTRTLLAVSAGGVIPTDTLVIERSALDGFDGSPYVTIPPSVQRIERFSVEGGTRMPTAVEFPCRTRDDGEDARKPSVFRVVRGSYAHHFAVQNQIPYLDAVDQPLDECAGQRTVGLDLRGILLQRPVLLNLRTHRPQAVLQLLHFHSEVGNAAFVLLLVVEVFILGKNTVDEVFI